MKSPGWIRAGAVATVCALVGAGAGIAGSTAAPGKPAKNRDKARAAPEGRHRGPGLRPDRAVHVEAAVLDDAGTAYITQTLDNGVVKAVSGQDLTITEGTAKVPYKDVTVAVPAAATIIRNGAKATLTDLKAGDHVFVSASSDATTVFAGDEAFGPGRGHHPWPGHGPRGPHGPDDEGPGGPVPGHP